MEVALKNKAALICSLMVLLAGCLWLIGAYMGLEVTAINGLIAAIGLCLLVAIAFKEED